MIAISSVQRDELVRFIEHFCAKVSSKDLREYNMCRRAAKMILKMPATISAKFISSQCVEVNRLCLWLDRINRACVHQSDNVRTQVSFGKEQLKMTRSCY